MRVLQKPWEWYSALPTRNKIGLSLILVPIVVQMVTWVIPDRRPTCAEAKAQREFLQSQPASTANFKEFGQNTVDVFEACIKRK